MGRAFFQHLQCYEQYARSLLSELVETLKMSIQNPCQGSGKARARRVAHAAWDPPALSF